MGQINRSFASSFDALHEVSLSLSSVIDLLYCRLLIMNNFDSLQVKNVTNLMKPEDSRQFHYKIRSYEQYTKDRREFGANFKRPYDISAGTTVQIPPVVPFKRSRFTWVKSSTNQSPAKPESSDSVATVASSTTTVNEDNGTRTPPNGSSDISARKRKSPPDNCDNEISSTTCSEKEETSPPSPVKLPPPVTEPLVSSTTTTTPQFEVPAWD